MWALFINTGKIIKEKSESKLGQTKQIIGQNNENTLTAVYLYQSLVNVAGNKTCA